MSAGEQELHYATNGTHVWVRHNVHGGYWECPGDPASLAYFAARGWEPSEPPPEEDEAPAVAAQVGQPDDGQGDGDQGEVFDPSNSDVAGVSAYLAEHIDDPDEVNRVLDLERAGKNRKTVAVPDGFDPITGE